ncbi:MAG: uncharacterized protein KVP18_000683 [Porospora cf. gigantea A]|uniref:uncharacterized protein n=1 Tax=Porospora cf. gigantea A TaxID=2853593 RepID=UPI003559800D|nr:MAG: hypothetical protein KVP18_000683 [Porospora cf. gigantea A]
MSHFCEDSNWPKDPRKAQWLLLWMHVCHFPNHPTKLEKQDMEQFLVNFHDLHEAKVLQTAIQTMPPWTDSRRQLVLWLSVVENAVRREMGLEEQMPSYDARMRRWVGFN